MKTFEESLTIYGDSVANLTTEELIAMPGEEYRTIFPRLSGEQIHSLGLEVAKRIATRRELAAKEEMAAKARLAITSVGILLGSQSDAA